MKYIIFGASGFIGRKLVASLLARGESITAVDMNWVDTIPGANCVTGDAFDPEFLDSVLPGHEVLYHLVSTTLPSTSNKDPIYDCESNVVGTLRLLDAVVRHGIRKVIFTSSGGTVYGIADSGRISEDSGTSPLCAYGISKLAIEKYLQLYSRLYGIETVVLRISNPYGPGQIPGLGQGVIATFVMKAIRKEKIEVWGDGSVIRDFIYIDDVINAMVLSAAVNKEHLLLNIGSGIGVSINKVIDVISDLMHEPVSVDYLDARDVDVPVVVLDISKANELIHWKPEVSFEAGVKSVINNFVKQ